MAKYNTKTNENNYLYSVSSYLFIIHIILIVQIV